MKQSRSSNDLAARLSAAASAPLQPVPNPPSKPVEVAAPTSEEDAKPPKPASRPKTEAPRAMKFPPKMKELKDTIAVALRPERELWFTYIHEASERTKTEGRVISAQEVALEVLRQHHPRMKS